MEAALSLIGAGSAFVAGTTGSLHCALMCGPLASAGASGTDGAQKLRSLFGWQAGRVTAYAAVGFGLGLTGQTVSAAVSMQVQPYLPFLMALGLVVSALDLARHVRPLPGVAHVARALARWGAALPPGGRAFLLGAATPFLPCGLLYGVFIAAAAAGSGLGGAALLGAFALGGAPALAGVQWGARVGGRFEVLRRAVPLAAAIILIWRGVLALQQGPDCH